MLKQGLSNANQLEDECHGASLEGKGRCDELWSLQGVKLLEYAMKIFERMLERMFLSNNKFGKDAIWVYARKRNNRCPVYIKDAGGAP